MADAALLRSVPPHSYTHVFVLGLVFAAADAFGIGAARHTQPHARAARTFTCTRCFPAGSNDVANSFATSVGSGSLSLKTACFVAVFTEFGGAMLLGDHVTKTIKGTHASAPQRAARAARQAVSHGGAPLFPPPETRFAPCAAGNIIDLKQFDGQPDTLMARTHTPRAELRSRAARRGARGRPCADAAHGAPGGLRAACHAVRARRQLAVGQQRDAPRHGGFHVALHRRACCARTRSRARTATTSKRGADACVSRAPPTAVGATIGVGIAFGGAGCVQWGDARHGVGAIVLSWLVSPLLAAAFASALFLATKYGVLLAADPHARRAWRAAAARRRGAARRGGVRF